MRPYRYTLATLLALAALPAGATGGRETPPPPAPTGPTVTASPSANATGGRATAAAGARAGAIGQGGAGGQATAYGGRGGRASANAGGNSYGGNTYRAEASPPSVFAAGLTTSNDTCTGSLTAGGSGSLFGLILGGTYEVENCNRRANARAAALLGEQDTAREILCESADFQRAALRTGRPCAADLARINAARPVAAVQPTADVQEPPRRPSYCRPRRGESNADRLMRERNCG